jgi:hypothetical protein
MYFPSVLLYRYFEKTALNGCDKKYLCFNNHAGCAQTSSRPDLAMTNTGYVIDFDFWMVSQERLNDVGFVAATSSTQATQGLCCKGSHVVISYS